MNIEIRSPDQTGKDAKPKSPDQTGKNTEQVHPIRQTKTQNQGHPTQNKVAPRSDVKNTTAHGRPIRLAKTQNKVARSDWQKRRTKSLNQTNKL